MEDVDGTVLPVTRAENGQFQKGYDSRRGSRASLGLSIIEWTNRMDPYTDEQLRTIAESPSGPDNTNSKIVAAQGILRSRLNEFAKNGKPLASDDLNRILEHTHGKPRQRIEVTQEIRQDPDALRLELLTLLADHPELKAALAGQVAGLLQEGSRGGGGPQTAAGD